MTLVRKICLAGPIAAGCLWSVPAMAQTQPYNCTNDTKKINIIAQPMARALDRLTQQTGCPISRDGQIDGAISKPVRGRYTPVQALKAMVRGTGLTGGPIRQGLGVTGTATAAQAAAPKYNCQNRSIRLNIPAMRLDRALDALSRQTRCPISRDFEVSGLTSRPIKGTYTPVVGLRTMLGGTGLQGGAVRQGLSVSPAG